MNPRHTIELRKGVKVEVLFTPSLFGVAKRRGLSLTIEDREDWAQVAEAYTKLIYIAALNAWEARSYDEPELGAFPHDYSDFLVWSGENPQAYAALVGVAVELITGRTLREMAKEALGERKGEDADEAESKKKASTFWRRMTGRLFRRSS